MERIVIEVNKTSAKKWRNSSQQQKRKLASILQKAWEATEAIVNEPVIGYARPSEAVAKAHYERVQKELPEYRRFLDRIRKNAEERGLTDEILNELLKKDD